MAHHHQDMEVKQEPEDSDSELQVPSSQALLEAQSTTSPQAQEHEQQEWQEASTSLPPTTQEEDRLVAVSNHAITAQLSQAEFWGVAVKTEPTEDPGDWTQTSLGLSDPGGNDGAVSHGFVIKSEPTGFGENFEPGVEQRTEQDIEQGSQFEVIEKEKSGNEEEEGVERQLEAGEMLESESVQIRVDSRSQRDPKLMGKASSASASPYPVCLIKSMKRGSAFFPVDNSTFLEPSGEHASVVRYHPKERSSLSSDDKGDSFNKSKHLTYDSKFSVNGRNRRRKQTLSARQIEEPMPVLFSREQADVEVYLDNAEDEDMEDAHDEGTENSHDKNKDNAHDQDMNSCEDGAMDGAEDKNTDYAQKTPVEDRSRRAPGGAVDSTLPSSHDGWKWGYFTKKDSILQSVLKEAGRVVENILPSLDDGLKSGCSRSKESPLPPPPVSVPSNKPFLPAVLHAKALLDSPSKDGSEKNQSGSQEIQSLPDSIQNLMGLIDFPSYVPKKPRILHVQAYPRASSKCSAETSTVLQQFLSTQAITGSEDNSDNTATGAERVKTQSKEAQTSKILPSDPSKESSDTSGKDISAKSKVTDGSVLGSYQMFKHRYVTLSERKRAKEEERIVALASDSKDVVYEECLCSHKKSEFEEQESKIWQMAEPHGQGFSYESQLANVGLLRFMGQPLFCFSKKGKPFVYVPELMAKKLLPLSEVAQKFMKSKNVWPHVVKETRQPSAKERLYIHNNLHATPATWMQVMLTPHGLHLLYAHLRRLWRRSSDPSFWEAHANSLFYRQRLAHNCAWTLQVTPPTSREQAGVRRPSTFNHLSRAMKTLTHVHLNPITRETVIKEVVLVDGGAGTSVEHYNLTPSLRTALLSLIDKFGVGHIAEPFCTCDLDVYDKDSYRPLGIDSTVHPQVTAMTFIPGRGPSHPPRTLLCWKRNNGFFVSVDQLLAVDLLPGDLDATQRLLGQALQGSSAGFLMELEINFLSSLGRKGVPKGSQAASSESESECIETDVVVEREQRSAQGLPRRGAPKGSQAASSSSESESECIETDAVVEREQRSAQGLLPRRGAPKGSQAVSALESECIEADAVVKREQRSGAPKGSKGGVEELSDVDGDVRERRSTSKISGGVKEFSGVDGDVRERRSTSKVSGGVKEFSDVDGDVRERQSTPKVSGGNNEFSAVHGEEANSSRSSGVTKKEEEFSAVEGDGGNSFTGVGLVGKRRRGLLVNLLYLRFMYEHLAQLDSTYKQHARALFFIKHWPHDCPHENYGTRREFEADNKFPVEDLLRPSLGRPPKLPSSSVKGDGWSGKRDGSSGKGDGLSGKGDGLSGKRDGSSGKGDGLSGKRDGSSGKGDGSSGKRDGSSGKRGGSSGMGGGVDCIIIDSEEEKRKEEEDRAKKKTKRIQHADGGDHDNIIRRKRGRPPKKSKHTIDSEEEKSEGEEDRAKKKTSRIQHADGGDHDNIIRRKRGRPPKNSNHTIARKAKKVKTPVIKDSDGEEFWEKGTRQSSRGKRDDSETHSGGTRRACLAREAKNVKMQEKGYNEDTSEEEETSDEDEDETSEEEMSDRVSNVSEKRTKGKKKMTGDTDEEEISEEEMHRSDSVSKVSGKRTRGKETGVTDEEETSEEEVRQSDEISKVSGKQTENNRVSFSSTQTQVTDVEDGDEKGKNGGRGKEIGAGGANGDGEESRRKRVQSEEGGIGAGRAKKLKTDMAESEGHDEVSRRTQSSPRDTEEGLSGANKQETGDESDGDDVHVLEDVKEEEIEVIDLVDSSSEGSADDSYRHESLDRNELLQGTHLCSKDVENHDKAAGISGQDLLKPAEKESCTGSEQHKAERERMDSDGVPDKDSRIQDEVGCSHYSPRRLHSGVTAGDARKLELHTMHIAESEADDQTSGRKLSRRRDIEKGLESMPHNLDLQQDQPTSSSAERSSVKEEKADEMNVNLDLKVIKQEVAEADEYFSDLPIAIVNAFPEYGLPSNKEETSSREKQDTDIVKEIKEEHGRTQANEDVEGRPAPAVHIKQEETELGSGIEKKQQDSDVKDGSRRDTAHQQAKQNKKDLDPDYSEESENSSEEENEGDLTFNKAKYPRTCLCPPPDDLDAVLRSSSVLQSHYFPCKKTLTILSHVGQAVIRENFVYTFLYNDILFINVGQLQDIGLLMHNTVATNFTHQGPKHWLQTARGDDLSFLSDNGVKALYYGQTRTLMMSTELLSFFSYEKRFMVRHVVRQSDILLHHMGHLCPQSTSVAHQKRFMVRHVVRQSDILLHHMGHLCPQSTSVAHQVMQQGSRQLEMIMQAWTRSFHWQNSLKSVEHKRLGNTQPRLHDSDQPVVGSSGGEQPQKCPNSWPQGGALAANKLTSKKMGPAHQYHGYLVNLLKGNACALYLHRLKLSEVSAGGGFVHCLYEQGRADIYKVKKNVGEKIEVRPVTQEDPGSVLPQEGLSVFEGAMLPKNLRDKNAVLKSGIGFTELDPVAIQGWIGDKAGTHHLILTGNLYTCVTATGESCRFTCFKVKDKLYVNWGELAEHLPGTGTLYKLARQLHVFLYAVPGVLGFHLHRHYQAPLDLLSAQPWICVNSVSAIFWLATIDGHQCPLFPKTFSALNKHFVETDSWNLQFRNFLLVPKRGREREFVSV